MVLLAGLVFAVPYVRSAPVGVSGGLDLGWLVGGNGSSYRSGFGERIAAGYSLANTTEILLSLDHSHHVLDDAGGYFPGFDPPPSALGGGRDVIGLCGGVRVAIDRVDEWSIPAERPRVYPYGAVQVGVAFTRTTIQAPAFSGPVVLQSVSAVPTIAVGVGAELRFSRVVSALPHLEAKALLAEDVGEVDGMRRWGAELRIAPGLDIRVGF